MYTQIYDEHKWLALWLNRDVTNTEAVAIWESFGFCEQEPLQYKYKDDDVELLFETIVDVNAVLELD